MNFGIGLSAGTAAAVSHNCARGDAYGVARLTAHSLWLAGASMAALAVLGMLTMPILFRLIGAPESALPLIARYMQVWYAGSPCLVLSMVALSALRAVGDSRFQGTAMVGAAGLGAFLAPPCILGAAQVGLSGLTGAAIANTVPWIVLCAVSFRRLWRLGMLDRARPDFQPLVVSVRRLLRIGLPAAATNVIIPVGAAVVTAILAPFGPEAIAGYGIATRVEALAVVVFLALSATMNPFAGQNLGAGRPARIRMALVLVTRVCLGWGGILALTLFVVAPQLASYFTNDPRAAHCATLYWYIVPISYGGAGMIMCINATFNGLGRPLPAVAISLARIAAVNVPVALLSARLFGAAGVFLGIAVANVLIAILGLLWLMEHIKDLPTGPAARDAGVAM
jgi:putative MATE family efflux protein